MFLTYKIMNIVIYHSLNKYIIISTKFELIMSIKIIVYIYIYIYYYKYSNVLVLVRTTIYL